jgi:SAM-dependent methyltransferase
MITVMTDSVFIFDKAAQNIKAKRVRNKIKESDFLYQFAVKDIQDRLSVINRKFKNILDLDTVLTEQEIIETEEKKYDQIKSILSLHNANDLPGLLTQIQKALKPDGLFIGCLFGGETLYELRDCLQQAETEIIGGMTPRVHPLADKHNIGALMQRTGYALPVIDSERVIVTYDNIFKLMHDLRYMGESNLLTIRQKSFTRRSIFLRANELYQSKYRDKDGRLEATFEIIFMLGWSPHESQQKPLKPGSAKKRLSTALNSEEEKLPC